MIKLAFSTLACPEMTLDAVIEAAPRWGYQGIELRTFGDDSRLGACDPALTSPLKTRSLLAAAGVSAACVATSARFDAPVDPPVIGHVITDTEAQVRLARRGVDLAVAVESPLVRVFGFEPPDGPIREWHLARIADRLKKVADHADRTGVRLVLENGGAFRRAAEIARLLDLVGSPLVGACWSAAQSLGLAGETPAGAINVLADRLWLVRVQDVKDTRPCLPGMGEVPCEETIRELLHRRYSGWVVYQWDRLWVDGVAPASEVLPEAAKRIFSWVSKTLNAPAAAGSAASSAPAKPAAAARTH